MLYPGDVKNDDYDYERDPLRNDPRRHLPNDVQSVDERQHEANACGEPYYPTPWECWHKGKWWNVPEDEQAELIQAETPRRAWHEIIELRLAEPGLFHGAPDEIPTPWDGRISDSANWGNIVTTTRIGIVWIGLKAEALGRGSQNTKSIGETMRALGWEMKKQRVPGMASVPWVWVNPEFSRNRISEIAESAQQRMRTDDDDIPF